MSFRVASKATLRTTILVVSGSLGFCKQGGGGGGEEQASVRL